MATGPLLVIVGPTASGKSALAMQLAERYNGEIICADSRTVYSHMDIGTAKPSWSDRRQVPHHLLDIIEPDEAFSASRFKDLANVSIDDITSRGRLPIIAGGTGLYVDGVIFDFAFLPPASFEERAYLQTLSTAELQAKIEELNIPMPKNSQNPRHLVRAIETNGAVPVRKSLRKDTLVIGLELERDELRARIVNRVDAMLEEGLLGEVESLFSRYGHNAPGLKSTSYKAFRQYLSQDITLEEAKRIFIKNDFHLARRQMTWFRRNPYIKWIKNTADAKDLVKSFLESTQNTTL